MHQVSAIARRQIDAESPVIFEIPSLSNHHVHTLPIPCTHCRGQSLSQTSQTMSLLRPVPDLPHPVLVKIFSETPFIMFSSPGRDHFSNAHGNFYDFQSVTTAERRVCKAWSSAVDDTPHLSVSLRAPWQPGGPAALMDWDALQRLLNKQRDLKTIHVAFKYHDPHSMVVHDVPDDVSTFTSMLVASHPNITSITLLDGPSGMGAAPHQVRAISASHLLSRYPNLVSLFVSAESSFFTPLNFSPSACFRSWTCIALSRASISVHSYHAWRSCMSKNSIRPLKRISAACLQV